MKNPKVKCKYCYDKGGYTVADDIKSIFHPCKRCAKPNMEPSKKDCHFCDHSIPARGSKEENFAVFDWHLKNHFAQPSEKVEEDVKNVEKVAEKHTCSYRVLSEGRVERGLVYGNTIFPPEEIPHKFYCIYCLKIKEVLFNQNK